MSAVIQPPTATQVAFEPLTPERLDELLVIEQATYAHPWTRGNFSDALDSGYSAWVCLLDTEMIGYFVLMQSLDEAHLLTIGVRARRQKCGFGARLLRHAMSVASHARARRMLLEVRGSNARALELYRHFGFSQIGVRKNYYPADGGREDALVLERTLEEVRA